MRDTNLRKIVNKLKQMKDFPIFILKINKFIKSEDEKFL